MNIQRTAFSPSNSVQYKGNLQPAAQETVEQSADQVDLQSRFLGDNIGKAIGGMFGAGIGAAGGAVVGGISAAALGASGWGTAGAVVGTLVLGGAIGAYVGSNG